MNKKTDNNMVRYLLGQVPEEQQLQMEEQFFENDEHYQQLLAVEDELRYEYAQGGLTRDQRKRFEQRFLTSEADRQRVALAGEILAKAYQASPKSEQKKSWLAFFKASSPFAFASAAAALLVVISGSWLILHTVQLQNRINQLEAVHSVEKRSQPTQPEQPQSKPPAPPAVFSFVLAPGLTRDGGGPKRLIVPAGAGSVQLQLQAKVRYPRYRASIQTLDGAEVWSRDVPGTTLVIPASALPRGDYMVTLLGITASGDAEDAGDFYFSVARR
jgi:hypothetical protein